MFAVITIIHVLACIFLVLVVLLQTGKGAEMGAVFGGSSSTVFGSSGAGNFLTRLTTATAIVFMLTSLGLTYLSARRTTSTVFDNAPAAAPAGQEAPVAPLPETEPQAGEAGAAGAAGVVEMEEQQETKPASDDTAAAVGGSKAAEAVPVEEGAAPAPDAAAAVGGSKAVEAAAVDEGAAPAPADAGAAEGAGGETAPQP